MKDTRENGSTNKSVVVVRGSVIDCGCKYLNFVIGIFRSRDRLFCFAHKTTVENICVHHCVVYESRT